MAEGVSGCGKRRLPPPWPPLAPQTVALMLHRDHATYCGAGAPPLAAFPAELRPRIWAQLMQLECAQTVPMPMPSRQSDIWKRADAMVAKVFNARKPGTLGRQTGFTREMKRTIAAVAAVLLVSPSAEGLGFLPTVAAGFVRVWGRDTASAAAATLSYLASYGVGLDWFRTAPFAPFSLLSALDDAFAAADPSLHNDMTTPPLSLGPPDYLWPALRSLLLEVLPSAAWTELMDHVLQRPPNFVPALVVAFVRANRHVIIALRAAVAELAEREAVRAGPIGKVHGPDRQSSRSPAGGFEQKEGTWKGYVGSPLGLDQNLRMPTRPQHGMRHEEDDGLGLIPRILEELGSVPATEIARRVFRRQNTTLNLSDLLEDADSLVRLGVQFGVEQTQPICVRKGVFIDHVGAAMAEAEACCDENYTFALWERCRAEEEALLQSRYAAAEAKGLSTVRPHSVESAVDTA
jgi:hypothetical protein